MEKGHPVPAGFPYDFDSPDNRGNCHADKRSQDQAAGCVEGLKFAISDACLHCYLNRKVIQIFLGDGLVFCRVVPLSGGRTEILYPKGCDVTEIKKVASFRPFRVKMMQQSWKEGRERHHRCHRQQR